VIVFNIQYILAVCHRGLKSTTSPINLSLLFRALSAFPSPLLKAIVRIYSLQDSQMTSVSLELHLANITIWHHLLYSRCSANLQNHRTHQLDHSISHAPERHRVCGVSNFETLALRSSSQKLTFISRGNVHMPTQRVSFYSDNWPPQVSSRPVEPDQHPHHRLSALQRSFIVTRNIAFLTVILIPSWSQW